MTKRKALLGTALAVTTIMVVVATILSTNTATITRAVGSGGYTCASVHFGMKDSDYTAMTYDCSTQTTNFNNYHEVDGVSLTSISATNCYHGGTYTAEDTSYTQYAVRIGKSKTKGTLTLTFGSDIIGCTVYALQYASDPAELSVNGQIATLTGSVATVTKANATPQTYVPYIFTFDATNTLTITTKQASKTVSGKSVSASRFYLADISLRVAM